MIVIHDVLLPEEFSCFAYIHVLFNHEDVRAIFPAKQLRLCLKITNLVNASIQPEVIHVSLNECGCTPYITPAHDNERTIFYTMIKGNLRRNICLK